MKRLMLAATMAAGLAYAAAADDDPALPALTVDNSAPTTMAAWMAANGVTDLSGYGEVIYAGTAEITNTTELAGWDGTVPGRVGRPVERQRARDGEAEGRSGRHPLRRAA